MLGIIGGTGLYKLDGIESVSSHTIETPFGPPSAELTIGEINGNRVAFLPRHGSGHQILPSEINFRANIWALKSVGVRKIISVSAVGSLNAEVKPGELATPSQYFDWTRGKRANTYFGNGLVAHISTANPSCPSLQAVIHRQAKLLDIKIHEKLTYACVEGPRLGTRAESIFLQKSGCDLVGMTNVPEAFLAREAQICYSTLAVVTDYDCWLDDPAQHASVDKVIELYHANIGRVKSLLSYAITNSSSNIPCDCRSALKYSVMTDEKTLNLSQKQILDFLRE